MEFVPVLHYYIHNELIEKIYICSSQSEIKFHGNGTIVFYNQFKISEWMHTSILTFLLSTRVISSPASIWEASTKSVMLAATDHCCFLKSSCFCGSSFNCFAPTHWWPMVYLYMLSKAASHVIRLCFVNLPAGCHWLPLWIVTFCQMTDAERNTVALKYSTAHSH